MEETKAAIKYCLYARKSTEKDELQALSIDSQIEEMTALAERDNLNVVDVRQESHSAKDSGQRPVFNQLIADIKMGVFNGILTWAPDRLSRNAGDLGAIVDLIDQGLLTEIRTYSQRFTNSPNDKFLMMILGSQAKLENDNKGENVKRGLRAKCQMGWRPGLAPLGYLDNKSAKKGERKVMLDPVRAPIMKEMFEKVASEGTSGRDLQEWMTEEKKLTTRLGNRIAVSRIYCMLRDTFYYGKFEYPVGSGQWYQGAHDPIITKELYDKVQVHFIIVPKMRPGTKEFQFTLLMKCGRCGSGVTAEERFRKLKDGSVNRHVYYHCDRYKERYCPEEYITEENLVIQFLDLLEKIHIDRIGIRERLQAEMERFRQFARVLGHENLAKTLLSDVDIRNYAKYVLVEGTREEKRELLICLKSQLTLKDGKIILKE